MADAAALKEEGNAKFKAGEYQAAIDAYTKSLELDPKQHLCLSNRSAAYLKLGNSAEQALEDAQKCVELAPSFAKGYSRQAAALQELKRWDEALKVCKEGLEVASDETLRKMMHEVQTRSLQDSIKGTWHGRVSEELGGYDQEMEFNEDGSVRVSVLGRSILGKYWLNCSSEPHHLSIQVPMPDMPPGMPPPPPVPYIVRLDDAGLHLCCPFMVMERPSSFDGPGYCLMKRGALSGEDSSAELSRLSEAEKLLLCARELTAALPSVKLEEPKQTDSEEVTRDKLMAQVRFESSMFAVQKKFGEELMKKVLEAVKDDKSAPEGLARTEELRQLLEKFRECGLSEDNPVSSTPAKAMPPKPTPPPAEEDRPEQTMSAPAVVASASEREKSEGAGGKDASAGGLPTGLLMALVVGAAVAAGLFAFQRSRRR